MTSTRAVEPSAAPPTGLRGRRGLILAAAGCVVSGGTALLAVGRVWVRYQVPEQGLAPRAATATGHGVAPAAATLALVALAGVLVLPATRGFGRRVAGVVIAFAGAGIAYLGAITIASTTDQLPGPAASAYLQVRATAWPWVALVAGVVAIITGIFAAAACGRWPAMGRRYESGGRARTARTEVSMWDRLDEGDDPTA